MQVKGCRKEDGNAVTRMMLMMRAAWLRPFRAHSCDFGRNSDASEGLQKGEAVNRMMLMMRAAWLRPFGAHTLVIWEGIQMQVKGCRRRGRESRHPDDAHDACCMVAAIQRALL